MRLLLKGQLRGHKGLHAGKAHTRGRVESCSETRKAEKQVSHRVVGAGCDHDGLVGQERQRQDRPIMHCARNKSGMSADQKTEKTARARNAAS